MAKPLSWLLRHAFIRFALVGGAGYFVNAAALAFSTGILHLNVDIALAFSIFVAMCFTWAGNRYITFRERRAHGLKGMTEEWLRFVGANLLGAVVNYGVALGLVHYGPWLLANKYAGQACGVLAGLVFNFTLSRSLVFRKSGERHRCRPVSLGHAPDLEPDPAAPPSGRGTRPCRRYGLPHPR